MTIQQACDRLTELCHQGHAQSRLLLIGGYEIKEVNEFEKLDADTVLVRSEIKWPDPFQKEETK